MSEKELKDMINYLDNILDDDDSERTVEVYDDGERVRVGTSSVIGKRNVQQDAIRSDSGFEYAESGRSISVLCDGMGGMQGGEKASQLCSSIVYGAFQTIADDADIATFFKTIIQIVDSEVKQLKDEKGNSLKAGTTLVSTVVMNKMLYWASVGDSRAYILRGNEILGITRDHNYMMLLNDKVKRGEITQEQADADPQREALVSYIGMGGVRFVDLNSKPYRLMDGDFVIMCSDGLYRTLDNDEIKNIVLHFGDNVQGAASHLTDAAMKKNKKGQDNTSVIVIRYIENGNCSA